MTNWSKVAEFFNHAFEKDPSLNVSVTSDITGQTLFVTIPATHIDAFMKNLPTFEAEVLEHHEIPEG